MVWHLNQLSQRVSLIVQSKITYLTCFIFLRLKFLVLSVSTEPQVVSTIRKDTEVERERLLSIYKLVVGAVEEIENL